MLLASITFLLLVYSTACIGAGTLVIRALVYRSGAILNQSAGMMLATAFALGQGILASLWLLLALAGWFSPPVVIAGVIVFTLSGIILAWRWIGSAACQLAHIWYALRSDTWGWQFIAGLTLLLCLAWITSIGRALIVDASAFYMVLPKVIAASHRLVPLAGYEGFTDFGFQGEMHYAALMALQSPDAARLFAWPTILAGAVILLALGRRVGLGRRGQWIALAGVFTSSAVIYLSGDGKTDLFAVPFGLAAYYWVLQVHNGPRRMAVWLTGLFSGFAIVAKISYLPVMAPGLALLLVWQYREEFLVSAKRRQALIAILTASLQIFAGLLLALIPHLIKNGIMYHNPLSPFGSHTIGWAAQLFFGPETTRHVVLTYPLALTFGTYWGQYGNITPLVLAFLPLAFLLPRPRPFLSSPLVVVTLAALIGLVVWIILLPSVLAPRYILASLLLFILLPARAAEFVSWNNSKPRWLAVGIMGVMDVIMVAVGIYFLLNVFYIFNTYHYLKGELTECERNRSIYSNASGDCWAISAINNAAEPGDRVYMMSFSSYWLRPDLIQCMFRSSVVSVEPDERWTYLHEQGIGFLLADTTNHSDDIDALNLSNPPDWLELELLYANPDNTLMAYQIKWLHPPTPVSETCQQVSPPAWDIVSASEIP